MSNQRPKLYLNIDGKVEKANFFECVIDSLHGVGNEVNSAFDYSHEKLTLTPHQNGLSLFHPENCPYHKISSVISTSNKTKILDGANENKGISLGSAALLISNDGFILLTRRSKRLKTFPGIWVPPGGHIEFGESLYEAAIRELNEETGIPLREEEFQIKPLCLFESCYPPFIEWGNPIRHHIVLYSVMYASLTKDELHKRIKLCEIEVDAGVWLKETNVKSIFEGDFDNLRNIKMFDHYDNFSIINQSVFSNNITFEHDNGIERLSTGTTTALKCYYKLSC